MAERLKNKVVSEPMSVAYKNKASSLAEENRGVNLSSGAMPLNSKKHKPEDQSMKHLIINMKQPFMLSKAELNKQKIIFPEMEDSETIDIYRRLRTKLLEKFKAKNKIVMVTSVLPDGGTTHITINLAAAFALDQSKTALVVDCNLRQPALHERLCTNSDVGLSDYFEIDSLKVSQLIYATGIPRLRLIPLGQRCERAVEFFSSQKMQHLLEVLKNRYSDRYIFLDTPPIEFSADARILLSLCDYVVLVVPYGRVIESQVLHAANTIGAEKLAGVILNR